MYAIRLSTKKQNIQSVLNHSDEYSTLGYLAVDSVGRPYVDWNVQYAIWYVSESEAVRDWAQEKKSFIKGNSLLSEQFNDCQVDIVRIDVKSTKILKNAFDKV